MYDRDFSAPNASWIDGNSMVRGSDNGSLLSSSEVRRDSGGDM